MGNHWPRVVHGQNGIAASRSLVGSRGVSRLELDLDMESSESFHSVELYKEENICLGRVYTMCRHVSAAQQLNWPVCVGSVRLQRTQHRHRSGACSGARLPRGGMTLAMRNWCSDVLHSPHKIRAALACRQPGHGAEAPELMQALMSLIFLLPSIQKVLVRV